MVRKIILSSSLTCSASLPAWFWLIMLIRPFSPSLPGTGADIPACVPQRGFDLPSAKYFLMPSAATAPASCLLTCRGKCIRYTAVFCYILLKYRHTIPKSNRLVRTGLQSKWSHQFRLRTVPLILPSHCRQKNKVPCKSGFSGIHKRTQSPVCPTRLYASASSRHVDDRLI